MKNDRVAYCEQHAAPAGLVPGDFGVASWADAAGLIAWQAAHKLTGDGFVGPKSVAAALAEKSAKPVLPPAGPITGLDLSGHNALKDRPAELSKARAAGHRFVWIKATESLGYVFQKRTGLYAAARDLGMAAGFYHFAQPDRGADDAKREAAYFVQAAGKRLPGDLLPVLDLESNKAGLPSGALVEWAEDWCEEAERLLGHAPVIYTYTAFWKGPLAKTRRLERWPLWVAQYPAALPKPEAVGPVLGLWRPVCWQYTGKGTIPGLDGHFDLNRWCGTAMEFATFCGG